MMLLFLWQLVGLPFPWFLVVVWFLCFVGVAGQVALAFYIGLTEPVAFLLIPCSPCAHFFLHRLLHRRIAFLLASRKEASRHAVCKQFQGLLAEYPDCKRSLQSAEGCRQKGEGITGFTPWCLHPEPMPLTSQGKKREVRRATVTHANGAYHGKGTRWKIGHNHETHIESLLVGNEKK